MNGFQGVHAAAVTPSGKQGEINLGAAFELIDYLCAAGVHGIVLFSEFGEYAAFTAEERSRLTYLAVKRSRVPVLVGVGSATMDISISLAREARDAGVAGILLPPPFFYKYDDDDLLAFYQCVTSHVGSGADLFISNTPASTSPISVQTVEDLLQTGLFAGVEDASGNLESFRCFRAAVDGRRRSLLVGNDALFTEARCTGAVGTVSAAACAIPQLIMALDRAIASGQSDRIDKLNRELQTFLDWQARFPRPTIVKMATGLQGLKTGPIPVPLSPGKEKLLGEFREWFRGWLPTVKKMAANA
ncbi:MAG TPA: dihydrodipicolinate synthase family protein [Bryobacteraceae bacterium]|nr:dihydrodipicolinate synthase family protein [Bryobacteraceae bacterium]